METRGKKRGGVRVSREASPVGVTKVRFTPALWHKWLDEFNAEPVSERVVERAAGIEKFRALCRKPLDTASDDAYSAPSLRTTKT